MATEQTLKVLVDRHIERAMEVMGLVENRKTAAAQMSMIADLPEMRRLAVGCATKAWGAILFVDMRGSTRRAERLGPALTYVTMHALLPALAHLVTEASGYIVGFRGDGLFACFGINETGRNAEDLDQNEAVREACQCGQAMIEGVNRVINPALAERRIEDGIHIGIGVDASDIIFTRIGITNAHEVTAYANAVNKASKLATSTQDYVHITDRADALFPRGENGTIQISRENIDDNKVIYPDQVLTQSRDIYVWDGK